jgi:DNA/RNA endonuclease YhcR with UshA esterase domain
MDRMYVCSAAASASGLLMMFVLASAAEPEKVELAALDEGMLGDTVTVEGTVKSKRVSGAGHVFLVLTDGIIELDVPIFHDVASKTDLDSTAVKSKLQVTGVVDKYRGELQVVPRKPEDIRRLEGA